MKVEKFTNETEYCNLQILVVCPGLTEDKTLGMFHAVTKGGDIQKDIIVETFKKWSKEYYEKTSLLFTSPGRKKIYYFEGFIESGCTITMTCNEEVMLVKNGVEYLLEDGTKLTEQHFELFTNSPSNSKFKFSFSFYSKNKEIGKEALEDIIFRKVTEIRNYIEERLKKLPTKKSQLKWTQTNKNKQKV